MYLSEHSNINTHLTNTTEIDNAIASFTNSINESINVFVPKLPVITKSTTLPLATKKKISLSNLLRRQWQRSRAPQIHRQVKELNREIRNECLYRSKHSTTHQLARVVTDLKSSKKKQFSTGVVTLILKKPLIRYGMTA